MIKFNFVGMMMMTQPLLGLSALCRLNYIYDKIKLCCNDADDDDDDDNNIDYSSKPKVLIFFFQKQFCANLFTKSLNSIFLLGLEVAA